MDTIRSGYTQLFSILGSYGVSVMAFIQQVDVIGVLTGLAGATLTFGMAYGAFQEGKIKRENYRTLKLQNDRTEAEMKKV